MEEWLATPAQPTLACCVDILRGRQFPWQRPGLSCTQNTDGSMDEPKLSILNPWWGAQVSGIEDLWTLDPGSVGPWTLPQRVRSLNTQCSGYWVPWPQTLPLDHPLDPGSRVHWTLLLNPPGPGPSPLTFPWTLSWTLIPLHTFHLFFLLLIIHINFSAETAIGSSSSAREGECSRVPCSSWWQVCLFGQ